MNKYVEQLVELSCYDREIDSFAPRIENVQKTLNAKKAQIAATQEQISEAQKEILELKTQIAQTNAHIAEFSSKIKDASKKSASVKTEREMRALGLEEELAKEQLTAANEEITRLEKIADSKEAFMGEFNKKIDEFNKELNHIEAQNQSELDLIQKDQNAVYAKKDKLIKEMNQKILSFYEKVRKWAHNTAVVPVRKQACYGCFMCINDKTYAAVIKSDDIITCPHCGRILYKELQTDSGIAE